MLPFNKIELLLYTHQLMQTVLIDYSIEHREKRNLPWSHKITYTLKPFSFLLQFLQFKFKL